MNLKTFDNWRAEYDSYDFASLIAESATVHGDAPFNQLAAMMVRLVDLVYGEAGRLSQDETLRGIAVARSMVEVMRNATANDSSTRARFEAAFEATIDRAIRFSSFPEYAKLIAAP